MPLKRAICASLLAFASLVAQENAPVSCTVFNKNIDSLSGSEDAILLIKTFPKSLYKIYTIEGLGSFYIDHRVDIIKNELRSGKPWEPNIVALMKKYVTPGSTVLDIGAHIGTHTLSLSQFVGDRGVVIAFEPQLKIFAELVMNTVLNNRNNIIAYRAAVGDATRAVEMSIPVVDNEGGTGLGTGGDKVIMIPIDSLHLDNVSFMKIDVENYEYDVLVGAKETIQRNRPVVIIEIMGNTYHPIPNREERVQKTLTFLKEMGYTTTYIENSWSDWLAVPAS